MHIANWLKASGTGALALALMAGAAVPAQAKKAPKDSETEVVMADAFRASAGAARVALTAGDLSGANARIVALQPGNALEKYVAGALRFEYAARRGDPQAERRALTDMLESNAAPPSQIAYLRYLAGYYSFYLGDQSDAIAQINYARQLGYAPVEATVLLADATIKKGRKADGMALVEQAIAQQRASGSPVPAAWFDRAVSLSYQLGKWPDVARWYQQKLALYPSAGNWRTALVNYMNAPGMDPQILLDFYRLQAATGALASERDFQAYATLAAQSRYSAEAKAVIEAGRANGDLLPGELVTSGLMKTILQKAAKDMAALPGLAAKGASSTSGAAAATAGDAYFAVSQFPQAAAQYRLALSKGGVDTARVSARLGIALARSGDLPGAKAALAQATGAWSVIAAFWATWVDVQAQRSATITPLPLAAATAG